MKIWFYNDAIEWDGKPELPSDEVLDALRVSIVMVEWEDDEIGGVI